MEHSSIGLTPLDIMSVPEGSNPSPQIIWNAETLMCPPISQENVQASCKYFFNIIRLDWEVGDL